MHTGYLFILLIVTAIAYGLGYAARPKVKPMSKTQIPRDYLVGLNFLLNEEPDKAVDVFIKMLEVESDTVEIHLAVGKIFRRRGEVDRAIRIHQNLIARPQLERKYSEQALYELGQDYMSAGMLDRAERIFIDLSNAKNYAAPALRGLIDIYQQEKDWLKAVRYAEQLAAVAKTNMQPIIAHYYCELAEQAQAKMALNQALDYLQMAYTYDNACVRASLLQGKTLIEQEQYMAAMRVLKRIQKQNPLYLSEAIELLATCYEKLHAEEKLVIYLKKLLDDYPRLPIVLILAERIRKWKGDKVAASFVADYVRRYPSLRGLYLFINLYIGTVVGRAKEDLIILQNLMKNLLANKADYQCNSCGFSGNTLHWQCPGCKRWGTILPICNLEGEQPR